jgi:PilZ domain
MPNQQERRNNERVHCRLACLYELTKPVDSSIVKFSEGYGHSINCSGSGMLLLFPEEVDQRQVVEIQVPSEATKHQITKLVEVCWTRPITVSARVTMYLVGIRFLFELPVSS